MYLKKIKKLLSGVLMGAMMLTSISAMPVMAADSYDIELIIEDVTAENTNTLNGEAKFKISVSGIEDKITYGQVGLNFESENMTFKSVDYIHGAEQADNVNISNKEIAAKKYLMPGFACARTPIEDEDGTVELFIITFEGGESADDSVTLKVDLEDTMIGITKTVGSTGSSHKPTVADKYKSVTANASATENTGVSAKITLSMDDVKSYAGTDMQNPITLTLISDSGVEYKETLTADNLTSGSTPKFVIEKTVVSGAYTVEVKANGYKTYTEDNVSASSLKNLTISTDDFVPGDVNGDGNVDLIDYTLFMSVFEDKINAHSSLTDYDRDGNTNYRDLNAIKAALENADGDIDTDGDVKLTVNADNSSVKVNDTFTLSLKAENVYTYYMNGTWDTSLATLQSASVKGSTEDNYKAVNVNKDGKFTFMNTVNSADGNDVIYELTFKAKKKGSFALTFTEAYAMNEAESINDEDVKELKAENATVTIASSGEGGSGGGTGGGTGSTGGGGGSTPSVTTPTTPSTTTPSTTTPSTTTPSNETFTDIANYGWAKDSIYMLKDKGIISGVSETEYAPANNIKRGDFILILTRMLNLTNEYSENFADVPESAYYYDALGKAKAAGIATGDGINFMPENSITRQDLITLAYRAFLNAGYITENTDTTALDNFDDRAEISDYAVNAMASMVNAGIIKGSDGSVNPKGNATRAEVAVMCARLVELMNK